MKSNYRPLGEIIYRVDERNSDGQINNLIGVSIDKCFIKSVANTIGTDLSKYKVIRRNQFAVSLMQVSRDAKIPIACLDEDVAIMSPAYSIFAVKNENEVLPAYLNLWFQRSEFDREAAYIAVGGVRGSMPWDDFCRIEGHVPGIEEQRHIVEQYNVINKRIELKKKINDNLVALGLTILSDKVGNAALINKTQSEIENILLPEGWKIMPISQYCIETKSGATPSREASDYWRDGVIPWVKSGEVHNGIISMVEESITQLAVNNTSTKLLPSDTVLMAMYGVTAGEVGYLSIPATTNQAVCGMVCKSKAESAYLFFALLQNKDQASRLSNGGAQDNLSKTFIDNILLVVPSATEIESLPFKRIIEEMLLGTTEIQLLTEMQEKLLSQLSSR